MHKPRWSFSIISFVVLTCTSQFAISADFVGQTPPDQNGFRGWFDTMTGASCGVNANLTFNNWGNTWCSNNPPPSPGPVGLPVDLKGFKVTAFVNTTAASLMNPAGGTFATGGIATHTWGTFTNNGAVTNHRVVSSTVIHSTTINNNGTWTDINPSSALGTAMGFVTFNNNGLLNDYDTGNGITFYQWTDATLGGPNVLNNNTSGIIRESMANTGHINNFTINNSGTFEAINGGNLDFANCTINSTATGKWNALNPGSANVGFGFSGTSTLRGVFNGNAERTGTHRLTQDIVIADDTTFNIAGSGIYRWVCNGITIAPGKTLTNTGVFQTLNAANLTGNLVNNGNWIDSGGTNLLNATITNNGTITRNGATAGGTFQPATGSGTHIFTNNGVFEAVAGAAQTAVSFMRFDNNATVRNAAGAGGRMMFTSADIRSAADASWDVLDTTGGGAGFEFVDCTVQGVIKGSTNMNNDWRINGAMNVAKDTTFNITGGGISRWVASALTIAAGATLTNDGVFNHLNGWAIQGNVVNNGSWNLLNGQTVFNGHTFVNNGTINWGTHEFNQQGGSSGNLFTNNGLVKVAENNTQSGIAYTHLNVMNNGTIEIGANSRFGSQFATLNQGDAGLVKLIDSKSQLLVPDNATLTGGTLTGRGAVINSSIANIIVGKVILLPGDDTTTQASLAIIPPTKFSADTTLRIRVWGAGAADMHTFGSHRPLTVDGTLQLELVNGFTPEVGQKWTVAGGQSIAGKFAKLEVLNHPNINLAATYDATAATVTIAVESISKPPAPADDDADGVANDADNCPANANADQVDADNNGVGDVCETPVGSNPSGNTAMPGACGVGGCGAGAVTAMSMSLMSLISIKRRRRR